MKKIIGGLVLFLIPLLASASIDINLKYGAVHPEVKELQEFLIDKGFLLSEPTGNFYTLTRKAVIAYQGSVGLPTTGYVGPMTREKINNELAQADAISNAAEMAEVGTTTPSLPVATSSPKNEITNLQNQINAILLQLQELNAQTKTQTTIQQQTQTTIQQTQQNIQQIQQNTTPPPPPPPVQVVKPHPIFTYPTTGWKMQGSGVYDIISRFSVSAEGTGQVELKKLSFSVATSTVILKSPTFSGPDGSHDITAQLNTEGTLITVLFGNTQDRIVPTGTTKLFTMRATIESMGNSTTTNAISVALKSDTAPLPTTFVSTNGDLSGQNIIWLANTLTTATTDSDWANGYGLGGCFTSPGQDCAPNILSR